MRIRKSLRTDQENIQRFLTALGGGLVALGNTKLARPSFFISAHSFVREYIGDNFFKKEETLAKVLEENGFPTDEGPIELMRTDQNKILEAAKFMLDAATQWQTGDESARADVIWATSECANTLRQNLDRLRNLILPLLEQAIPVDDEHQVSERLNAVVFEGMDKNIKLIAALEEELSDWR
jgi:hemerythrin-like domain-containing protein